MKHSMQTDMMNTEWFRNKVKLSDSYAQNLYAAMCNNEFQKQDTWEVLTDNRWSCSWRAAGGVVATLREQGDYMNWYCSGMGGFADDQTDPETYYKETGYVKESEVTDEIRADLLRLGWVVIATE
jgi:hypothetical protein